MTTTGKLLVLMGMILILAGLAVWGLGRIGFRGFPGDIRYEGRHVRFYFPIVTCLILSILLTMAMWLWNWLTRR
jgi:hypothetical protein